MLSQTANFHVVTNSQFPCCHKQSISMLSQIVHFNVVTNSQFPCCHKQPISMLSLTTNVNVFLIWLKKTNSLFRPFFVYPKGGLNGRTMCRMKCAIKVLKMNITLFVLCITQHRSPMFTFWQHRMGSTAIKKKNIVMKNY